MSTYTFTALLEADLLQGVNGTSINIGDAFVMPEGATVEFVVTDDDYTLSGDYYNNEYGDDATQQTADITVNGELVFDDVRIYAEQYHVLLGSDGQYYYMMEIETAGSADAPGEGDDFFTFWGWTAIIVLAAITLPLGMTSGKEYAELEWPIDILITIVWILYAVLYFGTIMKRKTNHIYVANWFFLGMMIMITYLHVGNSLAIPVDFTKSYSMFPGVQDAMIQWWYGHNAVGYFLTAGFLGIMYYFIPKQAGLPIFSYRLSVLHFWALMFGYAWLGAHHLQYTALPDWAQSLGMVFSLVLLAPSWGGMINGIMTLSGAWHTLRTDPTLRFLVVSLSFYGMSTFEGPMMAIKTVNALSHNTDWTIGHVHSGALGWVAMISIGAIYHLIPVLFNRKEMWSVPLINLHFWLATVGTVLYIAAMWVNGLTQGMMWRAFNQDGSLTYSFAESVEASYSGYFVRFLGGVFFLAGMFVMAYNAYQTVYGEGKTEEETAPEPQVA